MQATDELRDKVIALINETVCLTEEEVTRLVTHLFSAAVMLRRFEELKNVRENMLEGVIGALPAIALLKAFHEINNSDTSSSEGNQSSQAHNQNNSNTSRSEENRRSQAHNQDNESEDIFRRLHFSEGEFSFTVNWNEMPKQTLKNLAIKNKEEKEGNDKDIRDLKLAISTKMLINPDGPGRQVLDALRRISDTL